MVDGGGFCAAGVALMGEVVELDVETSLPIPSERLLRAAIAADVRDVVILGYDAAGNLYFASSDPDIAQVNWLLDLAKQRLLELYGAD